MSAFIVVILSLLGALDRDLGQASLHTYDCRGVSVWAKGNSVGFIYLYHTLDMPFIITKFGIFSINTREMVRNFASQLGDRSCQNREQSGQ